MEKLSEVDFRKILNAIEILGRDLDYATFPERVVDAVAAIIDVDLISYNEVDPTRGTSRFLLRPDIARMSPDSAEYAALARRFGSHPIVAREVSRTAKESLASFVDRLRMLGMLGNCCGEAELRLNLGMAVASSGSQLVGIAINRSLRDFDDRDAACLSALRPHIVSAYRHARRLADAARPTAGGQPTPDPPLTRRESQVLYWVSMGKTNEEVGTILGARPLTVKKHLEHIYDKLGVPNRTAASRLSGNLALS
jgi:DNA-binding CsgD family transcriptional regulator